MSEKKIRQLIGECQDEELRKAYLEMLDGAMKDMKHWKWYAPWKMEKRNNCIRVVSRFIDAIITAGESEAFCQYTGSIA